MGVQGRVETFFASPKTGESLPVVDLGGTSFTSQPVSAAAFGQSQAIAALGKSDIVPAAAHLEAASRPSAYDPGTSSLTRATGHSADAPLPISTDPVPVRANEHLALPIDSASQQLLPHFVQSNSFIASHDRILRASQDDRLPGS